MNTNQFKRRLKRLGANFKQGKKHTKVYLNGRQSIIPRHSEITDDLVKLILKQLRAELF